MPINFVTGLPRQGKTLFTFVHVQDRAKRESRAVYYCNIPEVTLEGWQQIDHPDKWMDVPNDAIIVVDELQDFWGLMPSGQRVPLPILELSKHGKRGIDFYFITQDPTLVHATPRKLCETHYHVVRAFGSQNAVVHKFNRMQTDPEKVKSKSEKLPWRYPPEAFGKRDKAGNWITKPWYKSADVHNIKRQVPLKVWAIPGVAVLAGLAVWAGIGLFKGTLEKAKGASGAASPGFSSAVATPPAGSASGPGRPRPAMTRAEYLESFNPRVDGLQFTAPRYDDLTRAETVPYPAACLQTKTRCECFSQQATKLAVPVSLCTEIVKGGFFKDWNAAVAQANAGNASPAPSVAVPVAAAPVVGSM